MRTHKCLHKFNASYIKSLYHQNGIQGKLFPLWKFLYLVVTNHMIWKNFEHLAEWLAKNTHIGRSYAQFWYHYGVDLQDRNVRPPEHSTSQPQVDKRTFSHNAWNFSFGWSSKLTKPHHLLDSLQTLLTMESNPEKRPIHVHLGMHHQFQPSLLIQE